MSLARIIGLCFLSLTLLAYGIVIMIAKLMVDIAMLNGIVGLTVLGRIPVIVHSVLLVPGFISGYLLINDYLTQYFKKRGY